MEPGTRRSQQGLGFRPTSEEVSVAQLSLLRLRLHDGLAVVDEEHAVARDVAADDHVSLQEDLVVQFEEESVDEILVSVLEYRHLAQQAAAHHGQDLLNVKEKKKVMFFSATSYFVTSICNYPNVA